MRRQLQLSNDSGSAGSLLLALFFEGRGLYGAEDFGFGAEPVFKIAAVFTAAFFPELVSAQSNVFFGEFERAFVETGVREIARHDDLQGEDYCAPFSGSRHGRFVGQFGLGFVALMHRFQEALHGLRRHEEQDGVRLGSFLQEG
jgi:hypothetical protein